MKVGHLLVVLTALPLVADLLDRIVDWARRKYQVVVEEGDEFPRFAWLLLARVTHRDPDYDHDLWVIKLPFWRWGCVDWRGTQGWLQLTLFNRHTFQRREFFSGPSCRWIWMVAQI